MVGPWRLALAAGAMAVEGPHVAVVMSTHVVRDDAPANWAEFVVNPLAAAHAVHTFVCVGPAEHGKQRALWAGLLGVLVVAPPPEVDFDDQFTRLAACYGHAAAYEAARGLRFTHYVRARPDLKWAAPIAPIATFDASAVSLRARGVLHANDTAVSLAALSGSPKRGCDYFAKVLDRPREAVREGMRARGIPTCAVVDDMFAVVPRVYARAYFALEDDFPDRPRRSDFLPFADAFDDAAVRRHFGRDRDPDVFVATCRLYNVDSWQAIFDRTFHGKYGVGSHDFRHGCCEGRITWRLVGRLVPTRIREFPFVFTGRGSRGDPLRRMSRAVPC